MNTKSYIYDKDKCNLVVVLNYAPEELSIHHEWYSEWREGLVIEDHEFKHPKWNAVSQHMEEKTRYELVVEGIEQLVDGEYLGDGVIIAVEPDETLIKPKWNADTHIWEESATPEEIEEALLKEQVDFYNDELQFANKALTERACETISQQEFDEVKAYIQEINPYPPEPGPEVGPGPAKSRQKRALPTMSLMALPEGAPVEEEFTAEDSLDLAKANYREFSRKKAKRPAVFERYDREKRMSNNGIDVAKVMK